MARRSHATWVFLALVFGGAAALIARTMQSPESGAATGSSAAAGLSAGATASASGEPSAPARPPGSARSRWFAEADQATADPASLGLLGGLQLGSEVIPGWQLVGLPGVREGRLELLLDRRGEVAMTVWLERKKAEKSAAYQTSRYSIFYGGAHPLVVVPLEQADLAQAIRDRVAKSEDAVPIPPGL